MMRFMVKMVVRLPGDWPADRLDRISEAENARGHELIKAGKLRRLFRVVGRRANFSIWDAESLDELHENLQSLPMHPWMDVTVTALIEHPSEAAFKELYGEIPPLD
jgi:muconolactone D-isomerase